MADPLSITGTAIGIISLGVQACQGIIQYYNQWKDFDKDVASMYASIDQLNRLFRLIEEKLDANSFSRLLSVHEINSSIKKCEKGILELKRRLEKIKSKEPLGTLPKKTVILLQLQEQGKRLLYPFQQGTLGKLRDTISELRDNLNPILHVVQIDIGSLILDEVRQITTVYQEWRSAEEAQKILSWLSPLNFHDRHQEILSRRHPATGLWFLEHDKFRAWYSGAQDAPRGLWCVGKMGSGKSVLIASVVEHLRVLFAGEDIALAYIYCDWQDRAAQTTSNLLGCLVKELAGQLPAMPSAVSRLYQAYKCGKKPLLIQEQLSLFQELSGAFRQVYVIVDGLDECGNTDAVSHGTSTSVIEGCLKALLDNDLTKPPKVKLLISSRFGQQLTEHADQFDLIPVSAVTQELTAFISSELQSPSYLSPWVNPELGRRIHHDTKLCSQITERCVLEADETFLLSRLHIDQLKQQINMRQLQKAMRTLSADISQSISKTMDRIEAQAATMKAIGTRVLFWILRATRPLHIDELRDALAVGFDDDGVSSNESFEDELMEGDSNEEALIPQELVIASCAGLVSVNDQTGTIRLIHLSIKQHLEKVESLWFPQVHLAIARTCIIYLFNDRFIHEQDESQERFDTFLARYTFLAYSLENWGYHARLAPENQVIDEIYKLIIRNERSTFLFRGLYFVLWKTLQTCPKQVPGSFLAAYFGLVDSSKRLLVEGKAIDERDSMGRTALFIAAATGQAEIVKILLDHGGDVRGRSEAEKLQWPPPSAWWLPSWARDDSMSNALCVAAEFGQLEIVQMLIDSKADVGAIGAFHDGALEAATFSGHLEIVKFLLRQDAPITRNTLQSCAYSGRVDILEIFLKVLSTSANPDKISRTATVQDLLKALYAAALSGRTRYAERLLEYGVDPNEGTNTSYRTPLQAAASQGHIDMIELLLRYTADVDSTAETKHFHLIHTATHYDKKSPGTALQAAAFAGQFEAVTLLVKEGANVNLESGYYGTALQAAAAGGQHLILKMLLDHEANTNIICGFFGNPLQAAASKGSIIMSQALLDAGAKVNTAGGIFGQVLQAAAWSGNDVLVRMLLDAGADVNARGGHFGNALQAAAVGCPVEETQTRFTIPKATTLPLEYQSYIDRITDGMVISNMIASQAYGSMMRAAGHSLSKDPMRRGVHTFPGIEAQLLMTREGEARKVLLDSSQNSSENTEVVQQLLDAGADPNAIGGKHFTALQAACYAGHLGIVNLLLERGADLHASYEEIEYPWLKHDALRKAIDSAHSAIVKRLLDQGADAKGSSTKSKTSALHRAAKTNKDIVRFLIDKGAEVNVQTTWGDTPDGETPIFLAVKEDKLDIVKLLLQHGADVNLRCRGTTSVLELSVTDQPLETTMTLLEAGADMESINATVQRIFTADSWWSLEQWYPKKAQTLQSLLDHGANVNGGTAVNRDSAVEELKTRNRYPPKYYTKDMNPLLVAASQTGDNVEPVEMLVHAGADLSKYGQDALWLAIRSDFRRIVRYLLDQGVQPEEGDMELLEPLLRGPAD